MRRCMGDHIALAQDVGSFQVVKRFVQNVSVVILDRSPHFSVKCLPEFSTHFRSGGAVAVRLQRL